MTALTRPPRSGWYVFDLAEATAAALAIFKAEESFLEVVVNSRPREAGPIARRIAHLRSVGKLHGEESSRGQSPG